MAQSMTDLRQAIGLLAAVLTDDPERRVALEHAVENLVHTLTRAIRQDEEARARVRAELTEREDSRIP